MMLFHDNSGLLSHLEALGIQCGRIHPAAGRKLEGAGKSCAVPGTTANLAQKSEL